MPPMVTPSISTVNRLCWLKSPAVFLVVPLRTSRLNFTAIQLLLSVPPAGAVHLDPGEVIRRVLRVARLGHLCDAILAQLLRRVEDREAVLVVLAVRDHRVLDRRIALPRRADQRDLRDVVEDVESGPAAGALVLADVQRRVHGGRSSRSSRCGSPSPVFGLGSLLRLRFLLLR